MKVCLLYPDKEWKDIKRYADTQNVIQDLGLKTLFSMSAKTVLFEKGEVKRILDADPFLEQTMRTIVMVPLKTKEEIIYRQQVMKDSLASEEFVCELYDYVGNLLKQWDTLGRKINDKLRSSNSQAKLITDIRVLRLLVNGIVAIKSMLNKKKEKLTSEGYQSFYHDLYEFVPDDIQDAMLRVLENVSFYVDDDSTGNDSERSEMVLRPRIVLGCNLKEGLKCDNFVLEELSTQKQKYRNPKSILGKMQSYLSSLTPDSVLTQASVPLQEQADAIEYEAVRHAISFCRPFMMSVNEFYDQLYFQIAFYRAAINLQHHMLRFQMPSCFPNVCEQSRLSFHDLREFIMCMEQRIVPVGNSCDIRDKMLLIITGANQGGKSTFLRSVAIAQVMMQCGLKVVAKQYESGIFPSLFTHFTRREDSQMNSGRLDEELKRMNQIIENLEEHSLVFLNESFATTTEKEGSIIAYEIIKALTEAGVKVLTVTHLLSFAQKVYQESVKRTESTVEFFSAERGTDGIRTFRMVQHEPELTSFGMDLYEDIIGAKS